MIPVVASSALAARMERMAPDAVVAEGARRWPHWRAHHHGARPSVCDAVRIPVVAAGGIADGRGMAGRVRAGRRGRAGGHRFLTVEECCIADAYKERVLKAKDSDTVVTGRGKRAPGARLGRTSGRARCASSNAMPAANPAELEGMYAGSLRRAVEGDVDGGSMMAGQSAALVQSANSSSMALPTFWPMPRYAVA